MFQRGTIQVTQSYENPWWKTNKGDLGLWNSFAINGYTKACILLTLFFSQEYEQF